MGRYYSQVYLTILASTSASDREGFLQLRNIPPIMIQDRYTEIPGTLICMQAPTFWPESCGLNDQLSNEPLTHRDWALQERILSPRRLCFLKHRMYWECMCQISYEDGSHEPAGFSTSDVLASLPKIGTGSPATQAEVIYVWYNTVVAKFMSTNLTQPTDTLPTVAGIAEYFASRLMH